MWSGNANHIYVYLSILGPCDGLSGHGRVVPLVLNHSSCTMNDKHMLYDMTSDMIKLTVISWMTHMTLDISC